MRQAALIILLSTISMAQQGIEGTVKFTGSVILKATNHSVKLTWNSCQNTSQYNVFCGRTHGGPYMKIISGVSGLSVIDQNARHGSTYYYVVTAVNSQGESGNSNEIVVTIP
ncbi:MAG TPA: fibronectin type III domain-containing protein [Candidatus Sulfotelmatobacter sp.]|nr:fibronectin type III domain-containing protein [Candidatus Sulfotelmatobacter sp.]